VSDERARRVGLNEALFRRVNEEIESLNEDFGEPATMSVICECGDGQCMEQIEIALADYERVRADPLLFVVLPGHEIPAYESVVERADGWEIVRKDRGTPTAVAERTDPRS
jgi:hypothetical protein